MDNQESKYQCPDCDSVLEVTVACGAETYFCDNCKKNISRSRIEGHPNYEK